MTDPGHDRHGARHRRDLRRRIVSLALPAVVTLVANPLMGLVDTAVVGRIGAAELGGLGLAVAVLAALSWIFNFLVFGTTSTVARAVGAGDRDAAGRRVAHAAQVGVVAGVVAAVMLALAAPALLRAVGAVDQLLAPATTYLRIRTVGIPLQLLAYVGHGAFRGVADTRTPLRIALVANIVNAVLTVTLVLGLGAGIAAAAWSTVVAETVTVAMFAVLIRRTRLPLTGHPPPTRRDLAVLFAVSRDLFLRTGGLLLGFLAVTAAAARIGVITVAAHQVLYQLFMLVSFLLDGLAIAAQTLVGTALGAGDDTEARAVSREVAVLGVAVGGVVAVTLFSGANVVPRMLTDDPAVLGAVASAWWIAALGHLINGPVFALDGVMMGAEDFAYLRTWMLVAATVGGGGAQLVATTGGGLVGLWLAVQAMMLVRLVSLAMRVRTGAWAVPGRGLAADA